MLDKYRMIDSGVEWVGDIPQSWFVFPAGGVFSEVKEKNTNNEYNNAFSFRYGEIVDKKTNGIDDGSIDEALSAYRVVSPNTIMINGLNLNYDFITQRVAIVKEKGIITSAYLAVQPDESLIVPQFALYLFKAYDAKQVFHGMGSGVRKTLKYSDFKHIKIVAPSMDEQKCIVAYLDSKVQEIDGLIAEAKASIEEYKAWKASIIYEAVTKGIDPDVEMKDSKIDYIGEIPSTWVIKRLRNIGTTQNGISKGAEFFGGGYPFVSYGDVYKNYALSENPSGLVLSTDDERRQYSVEAGDIFFTRTSETIDEIGFSCVCEKTIPDATFAGFLIRVRPYTDDLLTGFAKYFFRSVHHRAFFVKEMNLVTRASLSQGLLKSMPVLIPPKDEQQRISDYLDKKCSVVDALIQEKQGLISDLEAYKKSLIFEVVTGKRRVIE